jgi:polysaccharide export outer membrane protein
VIRAFVGLLTALLTASLAGAQTPAPVAPQPPPSGVAQPAPGTSTPAPAGTDASKTPAEITVPADYVIGAEDVLNIVIWREKDLSAEVVVRPDGMVTLPLMNDVQAAGLTPEQFRQQLTVAASKFVAEPSVTVIVRAINSRKVYIMGEVRSPGPYPLAGPMTVLQLIARAGGLSEYADAKDIGVMRMENGRARRLKFNYKDVSRGRRIEQNVLLRPGDTVIVP